MSERDEIMDRMSGQWQSYIGRIIGVEYVTGKHTGCPFCRDGVDRFRVFKDFNETGGCICNQCGTFANGIDTLIRCRGTDFKSVVKELRQHLGMERKVKVKDRGKESIPTRLFTWDNVIHAFERHNTGCTLVGLKRAGAILGNTDGGDLVFAIPCCDKEWSQVDSCVLLSAQFKHLLTGKGEQVRHRTMFGHKYSDLLLCSRPDFSKAKVVIRVEGVTSYLAVLSLIPDEVWDSGHVVVFSNPAGASQVPDWAPKAIAESVRGADVFVLGDSDEVGLKSMREWAERIAQCNFTNQVRATSFGENGDKDLRDWIVDHNVLDEAEEFESLIAHCSNGELIEPDKDKPEGEDNSAVSKALELIKEYQLRVIGMDDSNLHIWSDALERCTKIPTSRSRVPEHMLVASIGSAAYDLDSKKSRELVKALFLIGGMHPLIDPRPPGIWRNVICQQATLYEVDEDGKMIEQPAMHHDGHSYRVEPKRWFDPDQVQVELTRGPEHFKQIYHRLEDLIDCFTWADNAVAMDLLPGMMLASMNASCFGYRPYVYITAPSNSGKTTFGQLFFDQLQRCLLPNSQMYGISTRAAVRLIGSKSQGPIFLDEFDNNRDAKKIVEMARQSSRDQVEIITSRGGQDGMLSHLRQVFWFCGIHSVDSSEADDNRMLRFEMKPGRLSVGEFLDRQPTADEREQLRVAVIAMALLYVPLAARLVRLVFRRLHECAGEMVGPHQRVLESIAVPLSVRFAVNEVDPGDEQDQFFMDAVSDYLASIGGTGSGSNLATDSDSFVDDLVSAEVRLGGSVRTVESILVSQARAVAEGIETQRDGDSGIDSYQVSHPDFKWFEQLWQQYGLGVFQPRKPGVGSVIPCDIGEQLVFIRRVRRLATKFQQPQGRLTAAIKAIDGASNKAGLLAWEERFQGWLIPLHRLCTPAEHEK